MRVKEIIVSMMGKLGVWEMRTFIRQKRGKHYLKRNITRISGNGLVRVAFVVYEPTMWDKQEPVYLEMLATAGVEPYLIVVPDVGMSQEGAEKKQSFFLGRYQNVVLYDEETIKRFEVGEFQYTFFQTPYSFKYPKPIQPYRIVKHTKICYIPYGYVGSCDFFEGTSNKEFFGNVYFGFMDNEPMRQILRKKFSKECAAGLQHFEFLGYPALEFYCKMGRPAETIKNVLWIPRWSYAEIGGGSHFLEYKNCYNELAGSCRDMNWTMRPHPLMFVTLSKQGLFSENEISAYKKALADANVVLDENSLLNDTLSRTDLMIADYSSIMIMYCLSGRPIIYCDGGLELSGVYSELRDAMYIAYNWEDVVQYIQQLKSGIDPLKEQREKIAQKEEVKHIGAAKRIVDAILNDYQMKWKKGQHNE